MNHGNRDNRNIAENLRLYRIKAGLQVKDLSKKIEKSQQVTIETSSIRKYEKRRESIPAVDLNCIAAVLETDIEDFYEDSTPAVLLDGDPRYLHLLEAFNMIHHLPHRDMLLYLARQLGKKP